MTALSPCPLSTILPYDADVGVFGFDYPYGFCTTTFCKELLVGRKHGTSEEEVSGRRSLATWSKIFSMACPTNCWATTCMSPCWPTPKPQVDPRAFAD